MRWLYTLGIHLYGFSIRLASLYNSKAREWISGRKGLISFLEREIDHNDKWVWFHAASLGEFEQGRPLLERIRATHPNIKILLTFFSPSGYLVRKNYEYADIVTYLPLDTLANTRNFVRVVKPDLAIFIKYEIWYNYFHNLQKSNIPVVLISAQLRETQLYFRPGMSFLERQLRNLNQIFVAGTNSKQFLEARGFSNVTYSGDTRIDRVAAIASAPKDFAWLPVRDNGKPLVVAGSTWDRDEDILIPFILGSGWRLIIAPHEVDLEKTELLLGQLPGAVRLSACVPGGEEASYIVVDTIGELADIYSRANMAYVGGGFGAGIHNVLEPAAHGIPVIFGPRYEKHREAVGLISIGAAQSVKALEGLKQAMTTFEANETRELVRERLEAYFLKHRGATDKIFNYLIEKRLI